MFTSRRALNRLVLLLTALALVAAACGGDDEAEGVDPDVSCEFADLNLVTAGTLTVATGDPAFPPWIGVGDDNFDVPESKTGFEGGLVYALAAEMGFSDDQVVLEPGHLARQVRPDIQMGIVDDGGALAGL